MIFLETFENPNLGPLKYFLFGHIHHTSHFINGCLGMVCKIHGNYLINYRILKSVAISNNLTDVLYVYSADLNTLDYEPGYMVRNHQDGYPYLNLHIFFC